MAEALAWTQRGIREALAMVVEVTVGAKVRESAATLVLVASGEPNDQGARTDNRAEHVERKVPRTKKPAISDPRAAISLSSTFQMIGQMMI